MEYTRLSISFRKGPWHHQQETRDGDVAIYRRWKRYEGKEGAIHYEVVRIGVHPEMRLPSGVTVPAQEAYPPSSSWGTRGWTYKTLPEAQHKYAALCAAAAPLETQP